MLRIWAQYKKEMRTYFTSSVAYVILTIFLLISGFFFTSIVISYSTNSMQFGNFPQAQAYLNIGQSVLRFLFQNLAVIMLFFIPILTMRLISEEKRSGTLKLLLSYPIRDVEVLLGKFFAVVSILAMMYLLTFPYVIFLFVSTSPEVGPFVTNYLGIILMGTAFISLGIFASAVTERQVVAAVISFGALIMFWVINWMENKADQLLSKILEDISIFTHMENFTRGIINTHDIVYYLLFTGFFLFLALMALESRTWRSK
ncbi:MAG: ABC transporter permease subunit [Deltaproteobacteria bacterium]|uniref:ABC transporter permease subunit n=1 Tax=Candidatus Zymogenus saltonus TaxID=2844893 RepID=A0A9D8KF57_9DELT|nr:ABC transporter permease subunit [Candidatus Zymogenus saltonus]